MTSINTNNSAMSALQTLRNINSSLETTQNSVSTGYRVDTASDNAAYWSIATTMRSDNKALSAVSDALGLGAAKVDTAYTAMDNAIDVVDEIKSKLVAATEDGVDKSKVQEEISQLQEQLLSIAQSASFSGENWVAGADGTKSVVSSFVRDGSGAVSVKMTEYALDTSSTGNVLFGMSSGTIDTASGILGTADANGDSVYSLDITDFTTGQIQSALSTIESALSAMTSAGAQLGSISTRIDLQEDFVSALSDSIDSGVGRLVDADMEEESSKLSALQTQQQLAIQSLSIANSSSQNILSLFRS
ncbi:flagellin N-terminal helical domain-containing protein (plasmid) [Rhizobium leguminosarum]|jgi:flagellin|uniref:Flagellin n=1 Tax=Rhizobium leguminosarum TaxID=384 RepID=A0A2Z4YWQ2_RHILE|nr:flagellin [Rhizobium leguminosarum]MDH6661544.1 flagellin [Rhizobium sophorae]ASS59165.1 flagellin [Rhizobium leguminosarum bv. viciae]AVC47804.1 bacterial flagellin N-terminal helical region family protein [Rhizobium leguminosarum bv. viciae]AXA45005.1 Bacterial flagellin N-terminal helical region family protein [Rhizobium leguminosarum]MBA8833535.1 flagellin [Rhizobium leguminosarum]